MSALLANNPDKMKVENFGKIRLKSLMIFLKNDIFEKWQKSVGIGIPLDMGPQILHFLKISLRNLGV